jgi:dynein intermediate chain 4, axonemal
VERGINTFNDPAKTKSTQTERITINEKSAWCTSWEMYDTFNELEKSVEDADDLKGDFLRRDSIVNSNSNSSKEQIAPSTTNTMTKSIGTTTIASESSTAIGSTNQIDTKQDKQTTTNDNYFESIDFQLNTFFMERLINQNTYQPKQAKYRGFKPVLLDDGHARRDNHSASVDQQYDGLSLEKLWKYTTTLTKDRNVSCITWNQKNKVISTF